MNYIKEHSNSIDLRKLEIEPVSVSVSNESNAKITIIIKSMRIFKEFYGKSISINNDQIFIDGKLVHSSSSTSAPITINVEGNIEVLDVNSCDSIDIKGNCQNVKTMSGNINCQNVHGNVSSVSGDIKCNNITGDVQSTSGNIKAQTINGNCKTVSGNIKTK